VFDGDSGATAGDEDVVVTPVDPTEPLDPDAPAEPEPESPTTPTTPSDSPALTAALDDARQALLDRAAAYAANDLVGAAQADEALQAAIERAIAASP